MNAKQRLALRREAWAEMAGVECIGTTWTTRAGYMKQLEQVRRIVAKAIRRARDADLRGKRKGG